MGLFSYIAANDEFWVGLQQGPGSPGLPNTWSLGAGGRYWIMGGWISDRYFNYDANRKITGVIEGKDYMDLWRSQPFGTPTRPRDYVDPTTAIPAGVGAVDVSQVVQDVISDVNALQAANWQFSTHPDYFWPNVLGKEYEKSYKMDEAFNVMQSICVEENFEWQIIPYPGGADATHRRAIMFYPRTASLYTPSDPVSIHYSTNFRVGEKIQVGDTSGLITDVIFSNQGLNTVPPNKALWGMPGIWMDSQESFKEYGLFSNPLPANTEALGFAQFGDATQVFDADGFPAVCFQKTGNTFRPVLSFYINPDTGEPTSTKMQLDFRIWRKLHFNFYHATLDETEPSDYVVKLHNSLPVGADPGTWLNYYISCTFPLTSGWNTFTLELPKVSDLGVITDAGVWTVSPDFTFDTTKVDFVSFEVHCHEAIKTPWITVGMLLAAGHVGEQYIQTDNPDHYFFRGPGYLEGYHGEILLGNPMPEAYLENEWVQVKSILGDYDYQTSDGIVHAKDTNIMLANPLKNLHAPGALLQIPGCHSISLSQVYFEKPQFTTATLARFDPDPLIQAKLNDLANPRRFKITHYSEVEFQSETLSRATQELQQYGRPKQKIEVNVDGDPRHLIGSLIDVYLDAYRPNGVFSAVTLMIDDVTYQLMDVDLICTITAGVHDIRSLTYSTGMMEALSAAKARKRNLQRTRPGSLEVKVI